MAQDVLTKLRRIKRYQNFFSVKIGRRREGLILIDFVPMLLIVIELSVALQVYLLLVAASLRAVRDVCGSRAST